MMLLKGNFCSIIKISARIIQANTFGFSFVKKRNAQVILKDYFSTRLEISTSQLQDVITELSLCDYFNKKDDRWGNLCLTIERNLSSFHLNAKISISRVKQNNQLFSSLQKEIIANVDSLDLQQLSKVAWSLVKNQSLDKNTTLLIYKRIVTFLEKKRIQQTQQQEQAQQQNFKSHINLTKKQLSLLQKQRLFKEDPELIYISGKNYVLLVWSILKSKIIDKKILMKLAKIATKSGNIENIKIEDKSILLYCLTNLQMQKIRATKHLVQNIISQFKEIQNLSMLTLVLLIQSFSHYILENKRLSLDNDNANKVKSIQLQLSKCRKFVLFVLQTFILRHQKKQQISHKFCSLLMFHLSKIQLFQVDFWKRLLKDFTKEIDQANVQDLTMTIQAITLLQKKFRLQISQFQQIILKRIWQIYNSIYGKSLNVIQQLIKDKKIFPPQRIAKDIRKLQEIKKQQINKQKIKSSLNNNDIHNQSSQNGQNNKTKRQILKKEMKRHQHRQQQDGDIILNEKQNLSQQKQFKFEEKNQQQKEFVQQKQFQNRKKLFKYKRIQ